MFAGGSFTRVNQQPDAPAATGPAAVATGRPARVVDSLNWGWLRLGTADIFERDRQPMMMTADASTPTMATLDLLAETRGPLRLVAPPAEGELDDLVAALLNAKRRALFSLCLGVGDVIADESRPIDGRGHVLLGGGAGTIEADYLVKFGGYGITSDPAPASRVDVHARMTTWRIVRRWVTDPAAAVDVVEGLMRVLGRVLDKATHPAPGEPLTLIADQWIMRPDRLGAQWLDRFRGFALPRSSLYAHTLTGEATPVMGEVTDR